MRTPNNSTSSDLAAFWASRTPIDIWAYDPARMMAELDLKPDRWQIDLLRSNDKRLLLNCSRQSGKTTTVACVALHEAMFKPHRTVLIFAPTGRQSQEFLRRMRLFYQQLGEPVEKEGTGKLVLEFKNGSRILPLPSEDANIRGFTPHLVVVDEAARTADALYSAIQPMLAVSRGRFIALSTPFGKSGWFHREWSGQGRTDWKRFQVTADDCPRIDCNEIEQLRKSRGESYVLQEFFASFEQVEGLVYPSFGQCVVDSWPGLADTAPVTQS